MKKITLISSLLFLSFTINAQSSFTADFEELLAKADSFLNGSTTAPEPRVFTSNGVEFTSVYDTAYGGYWKEGFAVSSTTDSVTKDFSNLYTAIPAKGALDSRVYLIGQQDASFSLPVTTGYAPALKSIYITNTAYAYGTMLDGNGFSPKFSSQRKDSFVLFIYPKGNNNDSVRVDLANFTNTDTTKNFILRDWVKVTIPNGFNGARFKLVSSDNGQFGMNTPAFFAMDHVAWEMPTIVNLVKNSLFTLYPSPTKSILNIENKAGISVKSVKIYSLTGQLVLSNHGMNNINIQELPDGVYGIHIIQENGNIEIHKIVKQS